MPTYYFATTYGSGSYNASTYQNGTTTTTAASGSSTGGATLANTGFDLLLAATLGSVIIFAALVIRFWKKPAKKSTVPSED